MVMQCRQFKSYIFSIVVNHAKYNVLELLTHTARTGGISTANSEHALCVMLHVFCIPTSVMNFDPLCQKKD